MRSKTSDSYHPRVTGVVSNEYFVSKVSPSPFDSSSPRWYGLVTRLLLLPHSEDFFTLRQEKWLRSRQHVKNEFPYPSGILASRDFEKDSRNSNIRWLIPLWALSVWSLLVISPVTIEVLSSFTLSSGDLPNLNPVCSFRSLWDWTFSTDLN